MYNHSTIIVHSTTQYIHIYSSYSSIASHFFCLNVINLAFWRHVASGSRSHRSRTGSWKALTNGTWWFPWWQQKNHWTLGIYWLDLVGGIPWYTYPDGKWGFLAPKLKKGSWLTAAFYAGWLDGLLGVAGMMTLLLWIIPENSLPKTHQ